MVMIRSPLTAEDHRRIREAANAVDQRTGSKIAIVITRVSDRYSLYTLAGAALGAFTAGGFAVAARPALSGRALIFVELCVFVLLSLLLDILAIRLALVPARVKQASARSLAYREFAAHLRSDERDRRRILIFVSLGERYVEIIADHATHASAPDGAWNRIVDELVASIQSGQIANGIVSAIESCDAILPANSEASQPD
jgi:putative membrane protein